MAEISYEGVGVKVRRRMNAPETTVLRVQPLIDDALLLLAKDIAKDTELRHLMMTDAATELTLDSNGVGDLTELMAVPARVLIDCLKYGEIYHSSNINPLVAVSRGAANLRDNFANMYLRYYLEGVFLHTISKDNNRTTRLANKLLLTVPHWSTLLDLNQQLVEPLVERALRLLVENRDLYEAKEVDD